MEARVGGNCFQRLGDTGQVSSPNIDVAALQADESTRSSSLGPSVIRRKLWRACLIRRTTGRKRYKQRRGPCEKELLPAWIELSR